MDGERRQSGVALEGGCDVGVGGNAGCAVVGDPSSYGVGFNGGGGGVSLFSLYL
jgi:hypothetical protein